MEVPAARCLHGADPPPGGCSDRRPPCVALPVLQRNRVLCEPFCDGQVLGRDVSARLRLF